MKRIISKGIKVTIGKNVYFLAMWCMLKMPPNEVSMLSNVAVILLMIVLFGPKKVYFLESNIDNIHSTWLKESTILLNRQKN